MTDVEMKDANEATVEKKESEATDKKEPTDHFFGKHPLLKYLTQVL